MPIRCLLAKYLSAKGMLIKCLWTKYLSVECLLTKSVSQMSLGSMSIKKIFVRQRSVGQISVGLMPVIQMFYNQTTWNNNDCPALERGKERDHRDEPLHGDGDTRGHLRRVRQRHLRHEPQLRNTGVPTIS
jgi:hypothetical protein